MSRADNASDLGHEWLRPTVRDRRPAAVPFLGPATGRPAAPGRQLPAATRGRLTRAQTAILRLIADGLTDAKIAAEMGWTRQAVSTEVVRIRARLDATNRAHAALLGRRAGLI